MNHLTTISVAGLLAFAATGGQANTTAAANPAATFCIESGGQYVIETEADGQRGYCVLTDGTRVDAWDYFRENWDKAPATN
ncbi:DUF333 domain-containing protein [Tropicimonas sediminicola]|uniref:Hemolysin n=1 Tax=Tropicimonas sediminicola TaxID=1031541 RepID=A0A239EZV7_9RHOB|nr:DUF333 domain-containing protein [Tropicimonas sediminicola]SNS50117.1 hypothetical protein SAMN05421757_102419 [Tropicimonas sediminicola]